MNLRMRGLRPFSRLFVASNRYQSTECSVDTVVIGGGCVGLAIARQLSLTDHQGSVLLLEKNQSFGQETSSRNSEVVHAGLYYSPGSLKAQLCVKGRHALYRYCDENNVEYSKCGKLLVATTEKEVSFLHDIHRAALENGVDDLEKVSREDVSTRFGESGVVCTEALFSPSSGVVDSHGLMSSMARDIVSNGGMISYNTKVVGGILHTDKVSKTPTHMLKVQDSNSGSVTHVSCRHVVNSAGLWARQVSMGLLSESYENIIPKISFVKGNYFIPTNRGDFENISRRHLIYPVPSDDGGLGVHATVDVHQQDLRFGPDTEWLDGIEDPEMLDYDVDPGREDQFKMAVGKYCRLQGNQRLKPAYSGIRPKARSRTMDTYDFVIESHGIPGFVGLYGIESPGLTSCLALADYACSKLHVCLLD